MSSDSGKGTSPASLRWTDPEDWTQGRQNVSAVAQSWLEGVRAVFLTPEEEDEKWENPWGVPTAQAITTMPRRGEGGELRGLWNWGVILQGSLGPMREWEATGPAK